MNDSKTTVGIIGLGSFGAFLAGLIPKEARVIGCDSNPERTVPGVATAAFEEVARASVVLLAVPLDTLPGVLERIKGVIRPETLLIDVCSAKVKPGELYADILSAHGNLLLTHPLFGPQSAAGGTAGHRLIVTKMQGEAAQKAVVFCSRQLGLEVHHMSAEEHDMVMARVHALTFFVARGLGNMGLTDELFMTPSYKMLMDLVRLDKTHSGELFKTIEQGNPYARQQRQRLMDSFAEIEASLE
jgi:prephenate dehydrogenase